MRIDSLLVSCNSKAVFQVGLVNKAHRDNNTVDIYDADCEVFAGQGVHVLEVFST